ncbi:PAS domain-containing protein [Frateuria hangzhouensis]|uniref:PAS domain-containing protein n=1 Tax=Frateuria hangzhouensis TaxID=2995589 RepID=UPI002260B1C9|nr:PAS domain-containing protein [Frateuria sp. STR12]MCX7514389.1 PAS domain-containing protein [Frateuria sp. STR12]
MPDLDILQQVIDASTAMIQVADRHYRLLAVNKASADEFERIFGVRPRRGDSMLELLSHLPVQQAEVREMWGRALTGETFKEIAEFGRRERRSYEMKFSPLWGAQGQRIGAFQFVYDAADSVRRIHAPADSGRLDRVEGPISAGLDDSQYRQLFARISEGFFVAEVVRDSGQVVDFVFLEVNQAFTRQTDRPVSVVLGRRVSEVIPGFPHSVIQRYGAVVDSGDPSAFEVEIPTLGHRAYEARAHALGGERFAVLFLEITRRKQIERALERSHASLGAIVNSVDQIIWTARPDGYHDFFNHRWYEFTGAVPGSTDGDDWSNLFHPDDRGRTFERWRHSLSTGEPYEIEYRLRHRSGVYRWVLGRAHPVHDEAGRVLRWMGTCTDIHEQIAFADQLELASSELSHRIKNIFAVISGLVGLSVRQFPECRGFADELLERLMALSEAHDYARPHGRDEDPAGQCATVLGLTRRLLRPYALEGHRRIEVTGDDGMLDPRAITPLSLAIHELATNAAKYGAFAVPDGNVRVCGERSAARFTLHWREQGGPVVREPQGTGFGSRLVDLTLRDQLAGELTRTWRPEGLEVRVSVPIGQLLVDPPA